MRDWLRERGVERVCIAGVVTHYAVLTAAFAAYDEGYDVVVLSDCCMSGTLANHEMALRILGPIATVVDGGAWWQSQSVIQDHR